MNAIEFHQFMLAHSKPTKGEIALKIIVGLGKFLFILLKYTCIISYHVLKLGIVFTFCILQLCLTIALGIMRMAE